jgi:thioredoxin-related protein
VKGASGAVRAWLLVAACAAMAPALAQEGLHHQDWFHPSFGVLIEDFAEARAAGKRLAIVWEQKGCIYCAEMHNVHFRDPDLVRYIRDNFLVVQLDFRGDRSVTDFDGEVMAEKALARKYRITTTPTVQFFPETLEAMKGKKGPDVEVARIPGLLKPVLFRAMFEYVHGRHYEKQDFPSFMRTRQ